MRLALLTWSLLSTTGEASAARCAPTAWPHWQAYTQRFMEASGRVVDRSAGDRSTSEGQAYALFFALVAGERQRFARVLEWTNNNLAAGKLGQELPAWKWGRKKSGAWGVLDQNAASDADLWLAYTLLEAARLWRVPRYRALGVKLLAAVVEHEITVLPGFGPMLLPGPKGFVHPDKPLWRLNPSYLPLQLLRRFQSLDLPGPWKDLANNSVALQRRSGARRLVPDWAAWRPNEGFVTDPRNGPAGSYDAIRSYLWASMLPPDETHQGPLRRALGGLYRIWKHTGRVPERVNTRTGARKGTGPVGFFAALLPEAMARADVQSIAKLRRQLRRRRHATGLYGSPESYYDQNLVLFALGFADGRYRFAASGALEPAWRTQCKGQ